jgi:glyceraldehyde-3-phosphate dehydrogenase type I
MVTVALNGFGRIGRNFLRAWLTHKTPHINLVAINIGPASTKDLVYAIRYDTLMGPLPQMPITFENNILTIDNHKITIFAQADPTQLPWHDLHIDWIIDATGKFTQRALAQKHQQAGAKKVLITAPAPDPDVTIIPGVNDSAYKKEYTIVSLGSCTTNAIVPMIHVINQLTPIEHIAFTTVHAYTNTQVLLDLENKSTRLSRAAAINMIPTTTGATQVVDKIFPQLAGKIIGNSIRVPITKVSLIDAVLITHDTLSTKIINQAFETAQNNKLKNILSITHDPVVSSDFTNDAHSVIIDGLLTQCQDNITKVFGWYDNEWAYSMRLIDFLSNHG